MVQTEYDFVLPKGYIDKEGVIHKKGIMRLATILDEMLPMRDPRVKENKEYIPVIMLSRVVTRLGSIDSIDPKIIEELYTVDFHYLLGLYKQINGSGEAPAIACPHCGKSLESKAKDTPSS